MVSMERAKKLLLGLGMSLLFASLAAPSRADEAGLRTLEQGARTAPNDFAAALGYGRALARFGREADALKELRRAVAIARPGAQAASAHLETARAHIGLREFHKAMAACKLAGAQPGSAAQGHACAAEAHLLWKRATEAETEVRAALAGGATLADAKVAEGRALELELRETEAQAAYRTAIGWQPTHAEARFGLGRMLVAEGKRAEGRAELRRALELDPSHADAAFELARLETGAEAIALLERAVRERPVHVGAWLLLGELEASRGRVAEALRAAEQVTRIDEKEPRAHVLLGRIALAEGKLEVAEHEGRISLGLLANHAPARLLLAEVFVKRKEVDLAIEQFQSAWGLDHGDPTALVRASEACLEAGRDTSAKAFAERATQEFRRWAPGWVALGDALASRKEVAFAKAAYEAALGADGPIEADAVRRKLAALR